MLTLPKTSRNQLLLAVATTASLAFVVLAMLVAQQRPLPGDVAILQLIHRDIPASLDQIFLISTELGGSVGIIIIVTLIAGLLAYGRRYSNAIIVILSVALTTAANLVIKELFKRARPTLWESIIHAQNFSFPSGHAMASSGLAFAMVYIAWRTRWRFLTLFISGIFVILVGSSRLYFGVHYPSDILGGWLASAVVVTCVIYGTNRFFERHTLDTAKSEKQ